MKLTEKQKVEIYQKRKNGVCQEKCVFNIL